MKNLIVFLWKFPCVCKKLFSLAAFKIHSFRFWHFNYNVLVWISLAYLIIKSLSFLDLDICFFPQPKEDSATIFFFLSKISVSSSVRSPIMQVLVCLMLSHKTLKPSWLFRFLFAALIGWISVLMDLNTKSGFFIKKTGDMLHSAICAVQWAWQSTKNSTKVTVHET